MTSVAQIYCADRGRRPGQCRGRQRRVGNNKILKVGALDKALESENWAQASNL